MSAPGPLVWIDCEMTGLNPTKGDRILEICCMVTDGQLNLLDPHGFERVIHADEAQLRRMDEWCTTTHQATGLWAKALESSVTAEQADAELISYLERFMPRGKGVLAGNTVHMDRLFLVGEFPRAVDYLHYRIVDVSSIKEIGYRHNPALMQQVPRKKMVHSARSDILESIAELKWYYDHYFQPPEQPSASVREAPESDEATKKPLSQ